MMFKNRRDAGEELVGVLKKYKNVSDTIVLALPRGGVVLGYEIAKALNLPLDIVVPRKIGAPGNEEYAIGAITETGDAIMNEQEVKNIDKDWLKQEMEKEKKEAQRRLIVYRSGLPLIIMGKTVLIVDDGIATGYTMRAAIASIKTKKPSKIIVAVPHGAKESINLIKKEVNEVVCLFAPEWYGAVGAFYENFPQTTDEEVIKLLAGSKT